MILVILVLANPQLVGSHVVCLGFGTRAEFPALYFCRLDSISGW